MDERKKVNLLLVDDSEANLIAMRAVLEELGENLITADSGKRALRLMLDEDFAVVLLDVDMPVMDGFEVAALMRQVQKLQHTPIIFLTALYQNESSVAKGYSLGAVDYLIKPLEPEILQAKVRFFIELYRKTAEIECQAELLREANRKLDDLNADLERRVNERTSQLQRAIADLEREIAERKQVERERELLLYREQLARAEAERANRLKDEFLATISHELRTPLNSILGWARVLNDGHSDGPTTARALETIERNARVQAQLVEDILDVSRIVTGKFQLQMEAVALDATIAAAIEMVRPALAAKNIELQTEIETGVAPLVGDAMRLQQVVWNLLTNAIKFTPARGQVVVSLRQKESAIELQVRDNGQGIDADFLPHVFDRFRQADGSTTRRHGGLGLGLAIVQSLVEMHGGGVRAESKGVGKGATFTVEFPFQEMPAATNSTNGWPSATQTATEEAALGGLRVLIVDDHLDTRELICFLLKQRHAQTAAAGSVNEALAILERWQPHVVLSDLGMPEADGYCLLTRLRALTPETPIPAVALTGYAMDEERQRALTMGFQDFLTKPVNPEKLISLIAKLGRPAAAGAVGDAALVGG